MSTQDNAGTTHILKVVLGMLLLVLGVIIVQLAGWGFANETLWDVLKLAALPAAIAILPLWLRYRGDKPTSYFWLVFVVLALLLIIVAVGGYSWHWEWTGIVPKSKANKEKPATDLWDWLEVVFVPSVLVLVGAWAADRYPKPKETTAASLTDFTPIAVLSVPLAAMAIAALALAPGDTLEPPTPSPSPTPEAPTPTARPPELRYVPATDPTKKQVWTKTRILVKQRETLQITASGEVQPNTDTRPPPVGPDGSKEPVNPGFNVLPGAENHAALIGWIDGVGGDTCGPFFIGQKYEKPMNCSGELLLSVNDKGFDNNEGGFAVNVTVTP